MGLIDVARLEKYGYDRKFEGEKAGFEHGNGQFEGPSSIQRAPIEPPSSMEGNSREPRTDAASRPSEAKTAENAHLETGRKKPSYVVVPDRRTDGPVDVLPLAAAPAVAVSVAARPA